MLAQSKLPNKLEASIVGILGHVPTINLMDAQFISFRTSQFIPSCVRPTLFDEIENSDLNGDVRIYVHIF